MKFNKAFTLIELLLVVAMVAIIFVLSAPFSLKFYHTQLISQAQSSIISVLQQAKHNAVLQKNDSAFGVKIDIENRNIILFQGSSYANKVDSFDETSDLLSGMTVSGPTEFVFSKLTGLPSNTGTITLTYEDLVKSIVINDSGEALNVN